LPTLSLLLLLFVEDFHQLLKEMKYHIRGEILLEQMEGKRRGRKEEEEGGRARGRR